MKENELKNIFKSKLNWKLFNIDVNIKGKYDNEKGWMTNVYVKNIIETKNYKDLED